MNTRFFPVANVLPCSSRLIISELYIYTDSIEKSHEGQTYFPYLLTGNFDRYSVRAPFPFVLRTSEKFRFTFFPLWFYIQLRITIKYIQFFIFLVLSFVRSNCRVIQTRWVWKGFWAKLYADFHRTGFGFRIKYQPARVLKQSTFEPVNELTLPKTEKLWSWNSSP